MLFYILHPGIGIRHKIPVLLIGTAAGIDQFVATDTHFAFKGFNVSISFVKARGESCDGCAQAQPAHDTGDTPWLPE